MGPLLAIWASREESGTGPVNWAAPPACERSSTGRGILIGPPFAGDPWDDRPTLGRVDNSWVNLRRLGNQLGGILEPFVLVIILS